MLLFFYACWKEKKTRRISLSTGKTRNKLCCPKGATLTPGLCVVIEFSLHVRFSLPQNLIVILDTDDDSQEVVEWEEIEGDLWGQQKLFLLKGSSLGAKILENQKPPRPPQASSFPENSKNEFHRQLKGED